MIEREIISHIYRNFATDPECYVEVSLACGHTRLELLGNIPTEGMVKCISCEIIRDNITRKVHEAGSNLDEFLGAHA